MGSYCIGVSWNGKMWVAVGGTANQTAYSYDGINWTASGTIFGSGSYGYEVATNGSIWVAVDQHLQTIEEEELQQVVQ